MIVVSAYSVSSLPVLADAPFWRHLEELGARMGRMSIPCPLSRHKVKGENQMMEGWDMAGNGPSIKELTQMINSILGQQVLTEQQLKNILEGAKKAGEKGGMSAVLDYLMHVTQADVEKKELQQFADSVRNNPQMGMDILHGRRKRPGGGGRR